MPLSTLVSLSNASTMRRRTIHGEKSTLFLATMIWILLCGSIRIAWATPASATVQAGNVSTTVPLAAGPVPTALALRTSRTRSIYGQQVVLSATLSPSLAQSHSAGGTVTFYNGNVNIGAGTISGNTAVLNISSLPVGTDCITAAYTGDTNFATSTAPALCYVVLGSGTLPQTITFPQPAAPAYAGTSVALTATASSGLPVTYTVLSGPVTASGTNGSTLTYTGAGTVVIEADQAGDSTYAAAPAVQDTVITSVLTEPVGTASPAITTLVTFSASGILGAIGIFTQGAANLDFRAISGGSCAVGTTYAAGQTCTVTFRFTPTSPGLRYGGIALATAAGDPLGNSYISGMGTGPQVTFSPGKQTLLGSGIADPSGVAVDGSGNIFVSNNAAQPSGDGLYEISATGSSIRQIGTFASAQDVSVDGSGNVFVASDRTTVSEVMAVNGVIPPSPVVRTISTIFTAINGMKVDANGNVFVANSFAGGVSSAIYEILAVNGSIPTSPTILTLGGSSFHGPTGVAVDASGNVFVSDENDDAIYEMLAVNGSIPASPTILTLGTGISEPTNVALDASGDVFVPDYGNHAVKEILAVNGSIPASPTILTLGTGFFAPQGLIVDGSGNVFVADAAFTQAIKLDYADPPALTFATTKVGLTSSDSPQTVTLLNDGNAPLAFSVPGSGTNPAISAGFSFNGTCPQLTSLSASAALAVGSPCTYNISFIPVATGPDSGTLVATDNNLNIAGATQTILLNGNGVASPTISFTVPNHTYGDPPFTVAATSDSPGLITYSVISGPATAGGLNGSTITLTGAGTVVLQASQAASGVYTAGTQNATFLVAKASQTINFTQPASPVNYGAGPINLSATASSGLAVTFSVLSGPGTINGNVLTTTGIGTIVIAADQAGNANYNAAPEVTRSVVVNGGIAAIALTATPSPVFLLNPVLLTAALSSPAVIPAGSVTFFDGSAPLGTVALSATGAASLSVSTLALGSHNITVQYSGGLGFIPETSSAVSVIVQDFNLNIPVNAQTIPHGGTATYSLSLLPIGGSTMPAEISFTLSGEPDTSAITFAPQPLPAGSGASTVSVTIHTPNYPVGPWNESENTAVTTLACMAIGALLLPLRRRRRFTVLLLALSMTLAALSGCGSGWKTQHFTILVTARSGQLAHTATATLTSQ